MAISPLTFYASSRKHARTKNEVELRIEEHLAKRCKRHSSLSPRIVPPFRSRLLRPLDDLWEKVYKQKDAYNFIDKQIDQDENASKQLRIFACEENKQGKRFYVVCSTKRFLHFYKYILERHWYELILEHSPIRLYFDIEFYTDYNVDVDGEDCMVNFKEYLKRFCIKHLDLVLVEEDILELDGSRPGKFSRHLIVHFPNGKVLEDFRIAKNIVDYMVNDWRHNEVECSQMGLLLRNKDGKIVPLVDDGVYTRNRNFRLVKSSKVGSSDFPLKLVNNSPFYNDTTNRHDSEEKLFKDALITVLDANKRDCMTFHDKDLETTLEFTDENCENVANREHSNVAKPSTSLIVTSETRPNSTRTNDDISLFPLVEEYILNDVIRARNCHGFIRCRKMYSNVGWETVTCMEDVQKYEGDVSVLYEIGGARYCMNIQREHKSNNVKWIVNIKTGVYWQKCYDPECRKQGYSSNNFPLPTNIIPCIEEPLTTSDNELLQFVCNNTI